MIYAVIILIFHWIADFLLQTHTMAINKSKSNYWLSIHVFYYTLGMTPVVLLIWFDIGLVSGLLIGIKWLLLNSALHWLTDYNTSRWTSKLYGESKFYGFPSFFSVIGLDQLIHAGCLLLSFKYFV